MDAIIRGAAPEDAPSIAEVHVACWREAYRGLLPDRVLDGLSVDARLNQWRATLTRHSPRPQVLVAERCGEILGFASAGPRRGNRLTSDAEIYALYVRASVWRTGLGRRLLAWTARELRAREFSALGLWVLIGNLRARGFYERLGGQVGGEQQDVQGGETVSEVAYLWPDISILAGPRDPCRSG